MSDIYTMDKLVGKWAGPCPPGFVKGDVKRGWKAVSVFHRRNVVNKLVEAYGSYAVQGDGFPYATAYWTIRPNKSVQYTTGELVLQYGPMGVFTTLQAALRFLRHDIRSESLKDFTLFRCLYIPAKSNTLDTQDTELRTRVFGFWHFTPDGSFPYVMHPAAFPDGTDIAEAVRLVGGRIHLGGEDEREQVTYFHPHYGNGKEPKEWTPATL